MLAALHRARPVHQARLLSSLACSSGFLSSIRGYAGELGGETAVASECTALAGTSAPPSLPRLPASQRINFNIQRTSRFQGAGRRPGFRVSQTACQQWPSTSVAYQGLRPAA
jgi:hypothetical protein